MDLGHVSTDAGAAGAAGAGVRLHERLPRRGELHRDRGVDRRAQALAGGDLGRVLQRARLGRLPPLGRRTVGKGIIDPAFVDNRLIFGALIGAIAWNLITWYYGIPSSSSHALIGGMIGAALAKAGTAPLLAPGILKTASFIFISPLLGMVLGALHHAAACRGSSSGRRRGASTGGSGDCSWCRRRPTAWDTAATMRRRPWASSGCCSSPTACTTKDHLPTWVVMSCFFAIGVGTMFGGWRIVKTMGQRITKLKPVGGFAAECAGSITLFMATYFGIPVSTTHTITGAIIGVGTTRGTSAVRWGVAGNIVIAWIVTIPASAGIAALAWWLGGLIF